MPDWSHVENDGTYHSIVVSEQGVATAEISKRGPTWLRARR